MNEKWYDEEISKNATEPTSTQKLYVLSLSAIIGAGVGFGAAKIMAANSAATTAFLGMDPIMLGGTFFGAVIGASIGAYINASNSNKQESEPAYLSTREASRQKLNSADPR